MAKSDRGKLYGAVRGIGFRIASPKWAGVPRAGFLGGITTPGRPGESLLCFFHCDHPKQEPEKNR
jgi:hypothetical protein